MELQNPVSSGRSRPRQGHSCPGGDYDLLACLADAAAAAPLGAPASQAASRQASDRGAAAQAGPSSECQILVKRHASTGRVSPSPPAEMDVDGAAGLQNNEREVRVTCNGTLGTFLLPSQTVQCHCARCAPDGGTGESHGSAGAAAGGDAGGAGTGAGAQQQPHHHHHHHSQAPAITPTEFERHSGLLTAKKWRNSIRLVLGDGTITIGKWLEQHNILPRPKCSGGPLGSPGIGVFGSGTLVAGFGAFGGGFGVDGMGHPGGPSSGNDSHTGAGHGHHGHHGGVRGGHGSGFGDLHGAHGQAGRCTLPPSRYPASEYVTGEEDEYDEVGLQLGGGGGAAAGADDEGMAGGEDLDGAGDDDDYGDGPYGGPAESAGGHHGSGRGGRRWAGHRGGRSGGIVRAADRRGVQGRGTGRLSAGAAGSGQGGNRSLLTRGHRGRHVAGPAPGQHRICAGLPGGQPLHGRAIATATGAGGSSGAGAARRAAAAAAAARAASSHEEVSQEGDELQEEGGGGGKGHSSSEGSPPSDDSKRRGGGSGGSGEGDGSGTGDGGDSRRPVAAEGERHRAAAEDAPGCSRRSMRHGPGHGPAPGASKPLQQHQQYLHHHHHPQQQHPQYPTGREDAADVATAAGGAPERPTRHAAKRHQPAERLMGPEVAPATKRARTRLGASSGGPAGVACTGTDDMAAVLCDAAAAAVAAAGAPLVRGWRFLGAVTDPAADQVLISVTISGRTYTGLLAPQHPVTCPPPAAAAAAAGFPPPLSAPATGASGSTAALALPGRRPGGSSGSGGSGRAGPACAAQRHQGSCGRMAQLAGARQDVGEATAGAESADPASCPVTAALPEDDLPDDGMPPDCPRCALCRRCALPVLALSPPTPGPAAAPSPRTKPSGAAGSGGSDGAVPTSPAPKAEPEAETGPQDARSTHSAPVQGGRGTPGTGSETEDHKNPLKVSPTEAAAAAAGSAAGEHRITAAAAQPVVTSTGPDSAPAADRSQPCPEADAGIVVKGMPSQPTSSGASEAGAATPAAAETVAAASAADEPAVIASTKVEVKSEGDSVDTEPPGPAGRTTTPLPPPSSLQAPQQQQSKPVPEASRTARQAGCGLGPLVEVKCGGSGSGEGALVGAVLVHSQCALWSPEVFVIGGAMYGVPAMIRRSRVQRCAHCGRGGASLSCSSGKCGRTYHLPCAMEAGAMLVAEPFSMACPDHRSAAAPHTASSALGPQNRLPPSRMRPAPSLEASQSTVTTTATAAAPGGGGVSHSQAVPPPPPAHSSPAPQPPQQVALPLSLQLAAGRRVVLPPPSAAAAAVTAAAAAPLPASRPLADASGLPALMMLRSQTDGPRAGASAAQPAQASSMPPPRGVDAVAAFAAAVAAAAAPTATPLPAGGAVERTGSGAAEDEQGGGGATAAADQVPTEADELPAKRQRSNLDAQWLGGDGSGGAAVAAADTPADTDGGPTGAPFVFGPAAAWLSMGQTNVIERRQVAAAAAAAAAAAVAASATGGIAMLANLYGGAAAAAVAGMSSAQLEMSAASDGGAVTTTAAAGNSQGQGPQGWAPGEGGQMLKRRWELDAGDGDAGGVTAAATAAAAAADVTTTGAGRLEGTPGPGAHPSPQPPRHAAPLGPPQGLPGAAMGALPPMFFSRGGPEGTAPGVGGGDTVGLGLGLGLDPASGLHLSHASALKLLQQHPQLGGALPEGVAAMLLAHHHGGGSATGLGLRPQGLQPGDGGGEGSVGSPGSTATQPARGLPGGGGRPRHHHHHHHHHGSSPVLPPGATASNASGSTGTTFGRAGGGGGAAAAVAAAGGALPGRSVSTSGGVAAGDESPSHSPHFHMPPPSLAHAGAAGMMGHMLPRAARNIESLLPSRPLLHNPYVPSSGDPSADLTLSKIAQSGSREAEAELLGGTTGRAGHSGRCAVCVIQRKGKCGTESAPKKCLRRQLVALQRATGGGASVGCLSELTALGGGGGGGGGGGVVVPMSMDDEADLHYADHIDGMASGGAGVAAAAAAAAMYMDERIAAAAAEQRARERARRETWSLPLGQGSGATGKRPLQQQPQMTAT